MKLQTAFHRCPVQEEISSRVQKWYLEGYNYFMTTANSPEHFIFLAEVNVAVFLPPKFTAVVKPYCTFSKSKLHLTPTSTLVFWLKC
jgi:hypothetical protein